MTDNLSKVVLITGASSGFGRDTAETLAGAGHTVFAGMRDIGSRNKAAASQLRAKGVEVVELDVTKDTSVNAAVSWAVLEAVKTRGAICNTNLSRWRFFKTE